MRPERDWNLLGLKAKKAFGRIHKWHRLHQESGSHADPGESDPHAAPQFTVLREESADFAEVRVNLTTIRLVFIITLLYLKHK